MTALEAREFINQWKKQFPGMNRVTFSTGDTIDFYKMTDDDAIRVATGLMDIDEQASQGATKQ